MTYRVDRELLDRVISYTARIDDERDFWKRPALMTGVLRSGDEAATAIVRAWLDRAVEVQSDEGNLSFSSTDYYSKGHAATLTPTGSLPASMGYPLLLLAEQTGDQRYRDAAARQMDALLASPRTSEGGIHARKEAPELWIDYVYMTGPFLARFGRITGRQDCMDDAYVQCLVPARRLIDPIEHLARHAWCAVPNHFTQSSFWARGNGWFVAGTADIIDELPNHHAADEARDWFTAVMRALAAKQDRSGYLRHILDDVDSAFESSGTLQFSYACAKGIELGLLGEEYEERGLRALNVVAGSVDRDGGVTGTAVPPGGPGVPFGIAAYGQGFFIQAALAWRDRLGI